MRAMILASEFGARLSPLTEPTPRALLRAGTKTLLDHLMEKLEALASIREVVLVTNGLFYNDFLDWKSRAPYRKKIIIESNYALAVENRNGIVNDLFLGTRHRQDAQDDYLVFVADNYFNFPLQHFLLPCFTDPESSFIGVHDIVERTKTSLQAMIRLDTHGKVLSSQGKSAEAISTLGSVGVYYFPRHFILRMYEYLYIKKLNPDKIENFIDWLSDKESLYGVEFDGAWLDVINVQSYAELKNLLETVGNKIATCGE